MNDHNQIKKDEAQCQLLKKANYFKSAVNERVSHNLSFDGLPRNITQFLRWCEGDLCQTNRTYLYSNCNKAILAQVKTLIAEVKKPPTKSSDTFKELKSEIKTLKQQVAGLVDANRDLRGRLKEYEQRLSHYESQKLSMARKL
ncbi:hypothetical protein [Teredinibacter haidensis]|uniref:hypothetical protein n=1 Tax=Teredinibacter haidensis TaxID=2731755 RepID=UPI000948E865|nr:hypothetical protein [Teredinibacter haidensis]